MLILCENVKKFRFYAQKAIFIGEFEAKSLYDLIQMYIWVIVLYIYTLIMAALKVWAVTLFQEKRYTTKDRRTS